MELNIIDSEYTEYGSDDSKKQEEKVNINYSIDQLKSEKDISDRQQIIQKYQLTGYLDRDNAIEMIKELRIADNLVLMEASIRVATNPVPLEQASDQVIVAELQAQINILTTKLLRL